VQALSSYRFQSTCPVKDTVREHVQGDAKKVFAIMGGNLRIEVLPESAVVPAFQLLDRFSKMTRAGGHFVSAGC
jgi:TRAP-type mannitol/chloroaromatic compound transport system substrate-binding protein